MFAICIFSTMRFSLVQSESFVSVCNTKGDTAGRFKVNINQICKSKDMDMKHIIIVYN